MQKPLSWFDMKRIAAFALAVLLMGILFPFASITHLSESYARIFGFLFHTTVSHIVMHAVLFSALSACVLAIQNGKPPMKRLPWALGAVIAAGVVQELIQAASIHSLRVKDSLLDLAVDILAGLIPVGILLCRNWAIDAHPGNTRQPLV